MGLACLRPARRKRANEAIAKMRPQGARASEGKSKNLFYLNLINLRSTEVFNSEKAEENVFLSVELQGFGVNDFFCRGELSK